MAKRCIDCDSKVGGWFFGKSYETCEDCGEYTCEDCFIDKDGTYRCRRCHNKSQRGGCFIATACYGIQSNEVMILRAWRDKVLLSNRLGSRFVDIYYKLSPQIADFIRNKPKLKRIVRFVLKPIVWFVQGQF